MWHRPAAAAALLLAAAHPAPGQVSTVVSRAAPPDRAKLDRLNLKLEWSAYVPVQGGRDAIAQMQVVDDQVFVQTRTGLLVVGSARTGELQWYARLGEGDLGGNTFPVAVTSQFVYAVHVTKMHAFYRPTGTVEFVTDLGSPATAAPVADEQLVENPDRSRAVRTRIFCVLAGRPGSSAGHRIAAYEHPRPIPVAAAPGVAADPNRPLPPGMARANPVGGPAAAPAGAARANPVDDLLGRYPPGAARAFPVDDFGRDRGRGPEVPTGGYLSGGRTPSLSVLGRVSPPYTLDSGVSTPSLTTLPSLRQPYRLRDDSSRDIQRTPSIGVIPPSVAASLALADLRPRAVEPTVLWEYGLAARILYPLFQTPTRVWAVTDANNLVALNKVDKKTEVFQRLAEPVAALPGRGGPSAYVPLGTGYVVAVEASGGSPDGGANILWRTTVGGIANRTPFVTAENVYAQGDDSGVVCLDRKGGDVVWRSDPTADRVVGANRDFVYVRDRLGKLMVFDARRATDPAARRSAPLGGIDLGEFPHHAVNTASDRLYLAADNGLVVCLRDQSPKYDRPVRVTPEVNVDPPPVDASGKLLPDPKKGPDLKKDPMPGSDAEPKKD
jgi:outer membrane protein assembly factor BamB